MLMYGDPGAGKTASAFAFANRFRAHVFHYLKADRDPQKLFRHYPSWSFDNVFIYDAMQAEAAIKAIVNIQQMVLADNDQTHHWVIFDTLSAMYKRNRDVYTMARFGKAYEEVVASRQLGIMNAQSRKIEYSNDLKGLINGFQSTEWDIMRNKFYGEIVNPILYGTSAHIIYICHAVPFEDRGLQGPFTRQEPSKNAGITGRYRATGQLPEVHPGMTGAVETVVHLSVAQASGDHLYYTVKETAAEWINEPTPFRNFSDYYMERLDNGAQPLG